MTNHRQLCCLVTGQHIIMKIYNNKLDVLFLIGCVCLNDISQTAINYLTMNALLLVLCLS